MRIGIDTHFISGNSGTGNYTYTAGLVRSLVGADRENEYVLYAVGRNRYYEQFVGNPRVNVRPVLSRKGVIRQFLSLPIAIRRDWLDVAHLHLFAPFITVPTVLAVHDLYYLHTCEISPYERVIGRLILWSVPRAAHVVTLSEFSRQDIIKRCRVEPVKVSVIRLAADRRFIPVRDVSRIDELRKRLGIRGEYILFVGRTEDPRKNLARLIAAYWSLKSQREITEQLVIAGRHEGGTDAIRQAVKARGLEDEVLMRGVISDDDLPVLYSGAKAFVYVSLFEGFGLPVLEAMACGTPVITSNTTCLPEVAGDAGVVITPESVDELTKALRRVLSDRELREHMRERGLRHARRFSWERAARETLAIYKLVHEERGL